MGSWYVAAARTDNGLEMTVIAPSKAQHGVRRHCDTGDRNEDRNYVANSASRDPCTENRLYPYLSEINPSTAVRNGRRIRRRCQRQTPGAVPTDSLGTAWVRLVQNALPKAMPLWKYLSSGNNRCRYSAALEGMKPTLPPGSRICSQSPVRPIALTCVRRRTCAITALVLSR